MANFTHTGQERETTTGKAKATCQAETGAQCVQRFSSTAHEGGKGERSLYSQRFPFMARRVLCESIFDAREGVEGNVPREEARLLQKCSLRLSSLLTNTRFETVDQVHSGEYGGNDHENGEDDDTENVPHLRGLRQRALETHVVEPRRNNHRENREQAAAQCR